MHANSTFDDFLHLRFEGKHILFQFLPLESFPTFLGASILTIFICLTERLITYALAHHWSPFRSGRRLRQSRVRIALWRTSLYWIATLCRALYMLVIMSYHLGMIIVTVTALSFGQLLIEYYEAPAHPSSLHDSDDSDSYHMKEPLLNSPSIPSFVPPTRKTTTTRPRSKSKPEHLFIHPAQSNIAQADIRALELGITMGDTERVVGGNMYFHPHHNLGSNDIGMNSSLDMSGAAATWEMGKGRDVARALLGSTNTTTTTIGTSSSSSSSAIHHSAARAVAHHRHRPSQDSQHFRIDMDDEDEEEDVSDSDSSV